MSMCLQGGVYVKEFSVIQTDEEAVKIRCKTQEEEESEEVSGKETGSHCPQGAELRAGFLFSFATSQTNPDWFT